MNKQTRLKVLNHVVYVLILILLYVLQTTPGLFQLFGTKPSLVLAAAVAISAIEGEFVGGVYGLIAGILLDTASSSSFGLNTILLCIACIGVGLLTKNLMQETLMSYLLYVASIAFIISGLQFVFIYAMWRVSGLPSVFIQKVLIYTLYTTVISPIVYYLLKWIKKKFSKKIKSTRNRGL